MDANELSPLGYAIGYVIITLVTLAGGIGLRVAECQTKGFLSAVTGMAGIISLSMAGSGVSIFLAYAAYPTAPDPDILGFAKLSVIGVFVLAMFTISEEDEPKPFSRRWFVCGFLAALSGVLVYPEEALKTLL